MALSNLKKNYHSYLKACDILSRVSDSSKFKRAGDYISDLENEFVPEEWMPSISSDDLTQIALVNQEALSCILSNFHFSKKLDTHHLTQLANHSLKAAFHILYKKQFLKKFGENYEAGNLKKERYHFINALAQNRVESYNSY